MEILSCLNQNAKEKKKMIKKINVKLSFFASVSHQDYGLNVGVSHQVKS